MRGNRNQSRKDLLEIQKDTGKSDSSQKPLSTDVIMSYQPETENIHQYVYRLSKGKLEDHPNPNDEDWHNEYSEIFKKLEPQQRIEYLMSGGTKQVDALRQADMETNERREKRGQVEPSPDMMAITRQQCEDTLVIEHNIREILSERVPEESVEEQLSEKARGKKRSASEREDQIAEDAKLARAIDRHGRKPIGSSYIQVSGGKLDFPTESRELPIDASLLTAPPENDQSHTPSQERAHDQSSQRVPWSDPELESLVLHVYELKKHDPKARLTGTTLERLQTHRFSPDEWGKVRQYVRNHGIGLGRAIYDYLRTYAQGKSTVRIQAAAAKQGKTLSQYQRESGERTAAKQGKTLSQYNREINKRAAAEQGKTLSQYNRESGERTAAKQGKTLSQYNREINKRTAAKHGKTLSQYNRDRIKEFRENMRNPEFRHNFLEKQYQRQQKKYTQLTDILNRKIPQAKTPEQAGSLRQELTDLQGEWETFQRTSQAERKELEGLLQTQDQLNAQLSNQEQEPLALEPIQLQANDLDSQIEESIDRYQQSELDELFDYFLEKYGSQIPHPDQS